MENELLYFGLKKEPFPQNLRPQELMMTPSLQGVEERFKYALRLGSVVVITGEVGSGKSTALRYACSQLHPSGYHIISLIASTGTVRELYRDISQELNIAVQTYSLPILIKTIKTVIQEIVRKKQQVVLVIDEAHLLRLDVYAQLHTLMQFHFDSQPLLPTILCGQSNLLDNLNYYSSRSFASRVVARSHLQGLKLEDMRQYLKHHLELAGTKNMLFSEESVTAIQQGSGGVLRHANHLARGALGAAASDQSPQVSPEHVRLAASELL